MNMAGSTSKTLCGGQRNYSSSLGGYEHLCICSSRQLQVPRLAFPVPGSVLAAVHCSNCHVQPSIKQRCLPTHDVTGCLLLVQLVQLTLIATEPMCVTIGMAGELWCCALMLCNSAFAQNPCLMPGMQTMLPVPQMDSLQGWCSICKRGCALWKVRTPAWSRWSTARRLT